MFTLSLSTEQEAKLVLAKAFQRRRDLNDKFNFLLLAFFSNDSRTEQFRLSKRRQHFGKSVPRKNAHSQSTALQQQSQGHY